MNPWVRRGLWVLGGLAALWLGYRAFFRHTVEGGTEEGVEEAPGVVPLFTPSGMGVGLGSAPGVYPAQLQGLSEFPSAVQTSSGMNLLDLLKFEREGDTLAYERQQAGLPAQQARTDQLMRETHARQDALRRETLARQDAAAAARQKAVAAKPAAKAVPKPVSFHCSRTVGWYRSHGENAAQAALKAARSRALCAASR